MVAHSTEFSAQSGYRRKSPKTGRIFTFHTSQWALATLCIFAHAQPAGNLGTVYCESWQPICANFDSAFSVNVN